jgi:hypothetical protein
VFDLFDDLHEERFVGRIERVKRPFGDTGGRGQFLTSGFSQLMSGELLVALLQEARADQALFVGDAASRACRSTWPLTTPSATYRISRLPGENTAQ